MLFSKNVIELGSNNIGILHMVFTVLMKSVSVNYLLTSEGLG